MDGAGKEAWGGSFGDVDADVDDEARAVSGGRIMEGPSK